MKNLKDFVKKEFGESATFAEVADGFLTVGWKAGCGENRISIAVEEIHSDPMQDLIEAAAEEVTPGYFSKKLETAREIRAMSGQFAGFTL